jgi:hypothetical protein
MSGSSVTTFHDWFDHNLGNIAKTRHITDTIISTKPRVKIAQGSTIKHQQLYQYQHLKQQHQQQPPVS